MAKRVKPVDICLLLEGTYPYVPGGVSSWVHDLIKAHPDLTFHAVCINARKTPPKYAYETPENMTGLTNIHIHTVPKGARWLPGKRRIIAKLQKAFAKIQVGEGLKGVPLALETILPVEHKLGQRHFLDSIEAWYNMVMLYGRVAPESSFLDYYWSWRGLSKNFFSIMLADVPPAKVYHAISTGYAGLFAYKARKVTGRPVLLTEHGIYTNERRIEITLADWLHDTNDDRGFNVDDQLFDVKDVWTNTFLSYSKACYAACEKIITLYTGNQDLERADGADIDKMELIPNGVDCERWGAIKKDTSDRPLTVALVGRVVPIKDIKTFIRACASVHRSLPDVRFLVVGPTEEDEEYFNECELLVAHTGLQDVLSFTGRIRLDEWYPRIDLMVLTSINEAQPLVVLEAGAAGIPSVATNVGACREILEGMPDEKPKLGPGGIVTPLANPSQTALAILSLLEDKNKRELFGQNMQKRVQTFYNKNTIDAIYADLYAKCIAMPDNTEAV